MTGNEKGQKKETPQPLRCGVQKKNNSKWNSLSYLRGDLNPSTTCHNLKLGRGSFRHFYFSNITFHFYMYKGLRGIGAVEEKMNVYTFPHLLQNVDKGSDVYFFKVFLFDSNRAFNSLVPLP